MNIVGLVGKLNSGKDTVAKMFSSWGLISFSLADPLKLILQDLFDIPDTVLWGPSEMRSGEIRQMLQELGTDFARKFRPSIWVDKLEGRIQSWHFFKTDAYHRYTDDECRTATGIIIPDVRFLNEAALITSMNGTLIRITRNNSASTESPERLNHISEKESDSIPDSRFTHIINNTGSLLDLEKHVNQIATEIFKNVTHPRA